MGEAHESTEADPLCQLLFRTEKGLTSLGQVAWFYSMFAGTHATTTRFKFVLPALFNVTSSENIGVAVTFRQCVDFTGMVKRKQFTFTGPFSAPGTPNGICILHSPF